MDVRNPAEAAEILDLLLKFFGEGERWIKGRFSDRRGNCCLVCEPAPNRDPALARVIALIRRRESAEQGARSAPIGTPRKRGWRRAVPSPRRIREINTIKLLLNAGVIVVCAGEGAFQSSAPPRASSAARRRLLTRTTPRPCSPKRSKRTLCYSSPMSRPYGRAGRCRRADPSPARHRWNCVPSLSRQVRWGPMSRQLAGSLKGLAG